MDLVHHLSRKIGQGDDPGLHRLKHLVVALGGVVCCPRVLVPWPLHVGLVLLHNVLVGKSVAKATVTHADTDVLSLCVACPVDSEVHRSLLVVLVHSRYPLRGTKLPAVTDKDHLGAVLVNCPRLHPGDLKVWKVQLTEFVGEVWASHREDELPFQSRLLNPCL